MARKAAALKPQSATAQCLLGMALLQAARGPDDVQNARAALDAALDAEPKHSMTLMVLTQYYLGTGAPDRAIVYANRAVAAHPKVPEVLCLRAQIHNQLQLYQKAIDDAAEAKRFSSNLLAEPYVVSGSAYYALGKYDESRREYEEAVRIQPTNREGWLGLAEAYERQGKNAAELAQYSRMLECLPNDPYVLTRKGRCLERLGRHDDALLALLAAQSAFLKSFLTPTPSWFRTRVSIFWRGKGDAARALETCVGSQQYLSYYGDRPEAAEVHLQCIDLGRELVTQNDAALKLPAGFIHAHLCMARHLDPANQNAATRYGKLTARSTSLQDILGMLSLEYDAAVLGEIIAWTPLSFDARVQKTFSELLQKGVPLDVLKGMVYSNERFGVREARAQGTEGGGFRKVQRLENPQPNEFTKKLAGTWQGQITRRGVLGRVLPIAQAQLTFHDDCTYESRVETAGRVSREEGFYTADDMRIYAKSEQGTATYKYTLKKDDGKEVLTLFDFFSAPVVKFTKTPAQPQPHSSRSTLP